MSDNEIDDGRRARAALKPAVFHILLVLSQTNRHGLGIADEVEEATGGSIRLGPGTLYRSLKEMTTEGLIGEVPARGENVDPRRKFYRITAKGRRIVRVEAERYENIVKIARKHDVLPEAR